MKKTIAVFFGGRSPEHDISIITALSSVIKPLELTNKYEVVPVYITKTGKWISSPALKDIKTYQSHKIKELEKKLKGVSIQFDDGLVLNIGRRTTHIDIAFPAMHGAFGEDGSLMGLLRMANVPFVGAEMDASVIAMDKVLSKQIAGSSDIPVTKYEAFSQQVFLQDPGKILALIGDNLSFPLFVKPAHLGSSIGITRVETTQELENAIEVALYYDNKVIVEESVENLIEVTVPIMGNKAPVAALVERPLSHDNQFFDFDTKYLKGGKKNGSKSAGAQGYSELPAKLAGDLYNQSVATALSVYQALNLSGMARIDLLIDAQTEKIYFNEVNPLPGSLYAHNWRAAGVSAVILVDTLVAYAEERFSEQQKLHTVFDSSFLNQF